MTDWDLIVNVNLDDLNDEKAELLYDQLIEINPEDESNIDLLRSAFKAAKCVMQVKALQADVAVEELEEFIKKSDKDELESLRKQVDLYKSTLVNQHGVDPMNQIEDYQNQIRDLKDTLEAKNNELMRSKRRVGDLETKLSVNEKEIESLQDEIESLKEEMESRQHGLQNSIAESAEPLEKLREKNKQIQSLLDELDLMERANVELANQVKTLKDQLSLATNEVRSAADEMEAIRISCSESQEMNEMLIKEKEYLLKENNSLRKELDSIHDKNDTLVGQLNQKIDALVEMVREKEEIIETLEGRKANSFGSKPTLGVISDKSSLLQQELTEKSSTIDYLKEQLAEAVTTIQGQNELIKKLTKKGEVNTDVYASELLKDQLNQMRDKIDKLEEELKTKDDELLKVTMMKTAYERGEYGLSEALNEVKSLKKQLLTKERHLEEAIQDLNQLSIKLNSYEDQLDFLKEMGGSLTGLEAIDTHKILPEVTDDRLKILRLQQTIIKLEDEKIALQEKLRSMRSMSPKPGTQVNVNDKKSDEERSKMITHLETLQDENRELQMGMKEILLGLRESDSQSDVVIDCPSLERLVNLLEGRSLSADLTNVIALKAELDLLRGHNEQLRMELKCLRHEHLKLIGEYANEILDNQCRHSNNCKPNNCENKNSHINQQSESDEDSTTITTTSTTSTPTLIVSGDGKLNQEDSSHDLDEIFETSLDVNQKPMDEPKPITEKVVVTGIDDASSDENLKEDKVNGDSNMQSDDESGMSQEIDSPEQRPLQLDKESQTFDGLETKKTYQNVSVQTEQDDKKCTKCSKLLIAVMEIKEQIERLGESIAESEIHYVEQIDLARKENDALHEHIQSWKEKYNQLLMQKDEFLVKKNEKAKKENEVEQTNAKEDDIEVQLDVDVNYAKQVDQQHKTTNKAIPKVLETIIQCLQKRIDQKEIAIQQLQTLIQQTHENYEREMAKLIEEKSLVRETIPLDPVSLNRKVQADELRIALEKCYKELEECKQEAYDRIQSLVEELEKEKSKSRKLQEQLNRINGRSKNLAKLATSKYTTTSRH
ncbi:centrosomal protein of 290 kDa-like [Tetranychus urticae]|uniref:Uncharacterized protein n=1 Tax=Tetranychus urticae TaxID=32264 RepID=T1KYS1_TETUR|nr:centrosomal protein of 290 kDa-like [Tetranychus urticae]